MQTRRDLAEKMSASWISCMTMMTQGDFSLVNISHMIVALKTSFAAVLAYATSLLFLKSSNDVLQSILIAGFVMLIDFHVHPSHFGNHFTEAIATGIMAGIVSLIFSGFRSLKAR